MNPSLANYMLKRTPGHILDPTPTMNTAIPLNTGTTIPALGLGTWQSPPGEVKKAVLHALNAGYRHIDCATSYSNEDEVGEALKEAFAGGLKREDVFITSKLWCTYHRRVEQNLNESLQKLGVDYLDLYLMHWPAPMNQNGNHPLFPKLPDGTRDLDRDWSYIDAYKQMEKLPATGKVKAIGVANHSVSYLEKLLKVAEITPAVNQIENQPYLPQQEVVDFCKSKGIHVTAYSPFGSTGSPLFQEPGVQEVAKKHDVGPGTVLLSWHLARGSSVLAKSVTASRIDENRKLIKLDSSDMDTLFEVHKKHGLTRYVFPPFGPTFGFPDTKPQPHFKESENLW